MAKLVMNFFSTERLALERPVHVATPADAAKAPRFLLESGDHWFTHDVGWFPVIQGPAEVQLKGRRPLPATLSATDTFLSSAGEVCGHHVQAPTSVVTHTFTGQATIEGADRPRLEGRTGFLEIRMAEDGVAYVFATAR